MCVNVWLRIHTKFSKGLYTIGDFNIPYIWVVHISTPRNLENTQMLSPYYARHGKEVRYGSPLVTGSP